MLVYSVLMKMTSTGVVAPFALSVRRWRNIPQLCLRIDLLRPDLALTFLPGFATVPLAERVMFSILRSSSTIRSYLRTSPVVLHSIPSLRRSVSLVESLAMASLVLLHLFEPLTCRASYRRLRCASPLESSFCMSRNLPLYVATA